MKKASNTIERYKDGYFNIDIVSKDNLREAWLSHDDYGVSVMMFGIPVRQDGHPAMFYNEFLRIVEANLQKHEEDYMSEYFD